MSRKQPRKQILMAAVLSACFTPLSLPAQLPQDTLYSGLQQQQQPVSGQTQVAIPQVPEVPTGPRYLNQQDTTLANQQTQPINSSQYQRSLQEPPEELTGFQRLVAASVGKILPIYGTTLFSNVPSTFAPVDRVPVTPDYAIGPGDELLIHLWGQVNLDGRYTVDRSGNVYLPQIGAIRVAGLPFGRLTESLKAQIGRNFRNFDLNVNIGQLRSIQVFIVGNAKRPGSYTISSLSTLVNALFASGGPTAMGSLRAIKVTRGAETVGTFDLYDLLLRGDKSKDVPLLSGDVIFIPPVGPMVAVAGSVANPALYEVKQESTVKDVLGLSGGMTAVAQASQLRLERISNQNGRSVLDIDLNAVGLATPVSGGDLLVIAPIVDRFRDTVTLRGNVADPRRFAWFAGMHVKDIIPNKEALLTRDYWEQRGRLGLPTLDSTPDIRRYAPDAPVAQFYGLGLGPAKPASLFGPKDQNGNVVLPDNDANIFGRRVPLNGLSLPTQNETNENLYSDSRSLNTQQDSPNGQQYGQTTVSRASTLDQENKQDPSAATVNTSISGAVTGTARRFPAKNAVVLSAPELNWSYAVVQRLNANDLTTQLIPFNLGKAILDGDPSQNLALERGDVVTIFSTADIRVPQSQQTKYVQLEGEFAAAGTYSVQTGETLRHLVQRVGGFTNNAYLYGSQFTRESTRVIQQQRLREYSLELERRIKLAEANAVNNALNPQDEVANIAGLQNARSVAVQLRQLTATGRIVLDVKPDSQSAADIPDIPLEDGDTFVVPQVPQSVDVFGSVYTQNSFLYDGRMRARDYLRKAGGGTRTADLRRSFILRADGSVVSNQYTTALFAGSFSSTHLYPGDAIIVPERVDKRPLLRNLVDVATIIGQFGLGVAAINVLR